MMYSGKPPFKSFTNGGTPGKDASAGVEGMTQLQRSPTAENCDPNLSIGKKEEALRKAGSPSPLLDDSHLSSPSNGSNLQLPKPDAAGIAGSKCEAAASELGRQSKEVSRSATKSASLPSPTKIPVGHQHGHGPRPHFCRSPRCASNNPEYATPAQPAPRKYLVSKRHLLPGAICSKDPAILASQTQDSAIIPPAPCTGKPPKPSRQLENVFRQPSLTNASDRKSAAPLAYETSPTRIPKPPSRSQVPQQSAMSPHRLSAVVSPPTAPASEYHFSRSPVAPRQLDRSLSEEEVPQERLAESDLDRLVHSHHLGSESSCSTAVESISPAMESTSPPAPGSGETSETSVSGNQLESSVTSAAGDVVLMTRIASPEKSTPPNCAEPSDSLASDHLFEESERPIFAATSLLEPSLTEVEDVTKRLAQKLVFETAEDASPPATDCDKREESSSAEFVEGLKVCEEDSNSSYEQNTDEQLSKSNSGLPIDEVKADLVDFQDEKNADEGARPAERNANVEDYRSEKNVNAEDLPAEHHADEEDRQDQPNFHGGDCHAQRTVVEEDYQAEKKAAGENCQAENNVRGEDSRPQSDMHGFDNALSLEDSEGQETPRGRSIASYIEEFESAAAQTRLTTERQCENPKYVRGKGRQLWRSDCRDSREVVFLKQTPQADRRDGDWMVDSILEGAISKLNPSGEGRVRVLVEAFESLMNLGGGDVDIPGRRASRVWCLNRMEKGEVDEDGEEFEDGDQRVDCYEVSGDALQLRASMRLSLGGSNRLPLYNPDEVDEIEMSAIQKVQDWDDDCRQSSSFEDLDGAPRLSQSRPKGLTLDDQENLCETRSEGTELTFGDTQRRISFTESHTVLNETDRSSEDLSCDTQTNNQFGSHCSDGWRPKTDASSTFSLDFDWKRKASRRRRYWKASPVSLEPSGPPVSEGAEKDQRVVRGTLLEPFNLLTEERGVMKEFQFSKKLGEILAEEERLRNPVAQGLPWTTDEPEIPPKPPVKEQTRPVEFRHYSNSRAIERAEFDTYVSERSAYMEMRRQEEERLRQQAEEEEIKRLRREMVPRAQLMPFFDQPFIPTRSSKRLTVPKEPTFLNRQHKRAKCIVWQQQHQQHQPFLTQTYDRPHVFN